MATPRIQARGLWKKFRRGELHDSLRDLIPALAAKAVGRGPRRGELTAGDFWALRDVSFEVRPGEALGIIGPNGAGKSTILKILSRILRPNRGEVDIRGRVGALIEIAAGFHPDLTGRENVYLQGAIMGMRKVEIAQRFDEIVDFSGIPDFIDTPVKRYSSGMNARLGFAIAAHMNPEVLLIDEVLAVGDLAFQTKAFDRLGKLVRATEIPVVVVSHQLGRIASLCTTAMLLQDGACRFIGSPGECIAQYVAAAEPAPPTEGQPIRLTTMDVVPADRVPSGGRIVVKIGGMLEPGAVAADLYILVSVRSAESGALLFTASTKESGPALPPSGAFRLTSSLQLNVPPGTYIIESFAADWHQRVAVGPSKAVGVEGGGTFHGSVQMNAELSLIAS